MPTHETIIRDDKIEPGSDRSFGLVVGGILLLLSIFQYFNGGTLYFWIGAPGVVLVVLGIVAPKLLHSLNVLWTKLGLMLGRIVTPVIMFLVYIISVVPIGLILRMTGKDLLRMRRGDDKTSYWINRNPPGPTPESLKDQF